MKVAHCRIQEKAKEEGVEPTLRTRREILGSFSRTTSDRGKSLASSFVKDT